MRATEKIPFGTTAAEIALMPPKEMRILPGAGHRIDGKQYDGFAFSSLKQMKLLMQLSEDHGLVAFLLDCTAKPLAEKRQVTLKKALPGVLLRTLSVLCSFALQW